MRLRGGEYFRKKAEECRSHHGCHELADNIAHFGALGTANVDSVLAGVAAYNCGRGGVIRAIKAGLDVDHFTTGKNYSADVLHRRARFASLVP